METDLIMQMAAFEATLFDRQALISQRPDAVSKYLQKKNIPETFIDKTLNMMQVLGWNVESIAKRANVVDRTIVHLMANVFNPFLVGFTGMQLYSEREKWEYYWDSKGKAEASIPGIFEMNQLIKNYYDNLGYAGREVNIDFGDIAKILKRIAGTYKDIELNFYYEGGNCDLNKWFNKYSLPLPADVAFQIMEQTLNSFGFKNGSTLTVDINFWHDEYGIGVEVRDDGIGMSGDRLSTMFVSGFSTQAATEMGEKGQGKYLFMEWLKSFTFPKNERGEVLVGARLEVETWDAETNEAHIFRPFEEEIPCKLLPYQRGLEKHGTAIRFNIPDVTRREHEKNLLREEHQKSHPIVNALKTKISKITQVLQPVKA